MDLTRSQPALLILMILMKHGIVVDSFNLSTDVSSFIDFSYNVCTHSTFCRSDNKSTPGDVLSCCAPCSCTDDCYIGNTCCPDANTSNRNTRCRAQSEYFDVHRGIHFQTSFLAYYVVDTCKDDTFDEDIVDGCLHPKSLDDHVMVSDPDTLLIYKNAKCAQCNGVQNYETWKLYMMCPYDDRLFSIDTRNGYILKHCSLMSKPRNQTDQYDARMMCSPEMIDTCNVTRKWDFYSEELERGCATYSLFYQEEKTAPSSQIVFRSRTFRNVYCYLCNSRRGTSITPTCFQKKYVSHKVSYEFEVALFANYIPVKLSLTHKNPCAIDEIEDPFTGRCKRLQCPFGETAFRGDCFRVTEEVYVSLSAIFILKLSTGESNIRAMDNHDLLPEESHTQDIDIQDIYGELKEDIQTVFRLTTCEVCEWTLYSDNIFMIRARPTKTCDLSKLLTLFQYLSNVPFQLNTSTHGKVSIQLHQINNYADKLDDSIRFSLRIRGLDIIKRFYRPIGCLIGAHLTTKFYCKSLTFSVNEIRVKEVLEKLIKVSDPFIYNENIVSDYIICLSDYKRIYDELHVNNSGVSGLNRLLEFCYILPMFLTSISYLTRTV